MLKKQQKNSNDEEGNLREVLVNPNYSDLKTISSLSNSENHKNFKSLKKLEKSEILNSINAQNQSLLLNPKLPKFVRFSILFLLVVSFYFFIAADYQIVGGLNLITAQSPDFIDQIKSVSTFSTPKTTKDMWDAGLYPLVIILCTFSIVWPYVKLILMIVCWVLPPKKISLKAREKILIYLDQMGKFSLVDTYVTLILIVGFEYKINTVQVKEKVLLTTGMRVYVQWAFYALVLGTLLTLVLTHLIIYCHRKVRDLDIEYNENEKRILAPEKTSQKIIIFCGLFASASLLVYGSLINSFNFEIQGLVGYQLKENNIHQESIITMGVELNSRSSDANSFGMRFIQTLYFLICIVFPLAFLLILGTLLLKPLSLRQQKKIFFFAEMCNAWSALDVFLIALFSTLLIMKKYIAFLTKDSCDEVNQWLEKLEEFDILDLPGGSKCFTIATTFDKGIWVLLTSVVIYFLYSTIVLRYCQKKINLFRIQKEKQSIAPDDEYLIEQILSQKEN